MEKIAKLIPESMALVLCCKAPPAPIEIYRFTLMPGQNISG